MFKNRITNLAFLYIFLSICLHIIASFYSIGFYSDDEQFQILEPTAYLLGLNDIVVEDKTGYYWEWRAHIRMRPWFQPYIYYHFIKFLNLIGMDNSFQWILTIKVISGLLGLSSVVYLFFTLKNFFFKEDNHFNYFIFFCFWFYPFLHTRTSSDNLSITLFIFSFCILYNQIQNNKIKFNYLLFVLGCFLLGLSMVTKFNLVFTTLPFFIWLLIFNFNLYRIPLFGIIVLLALFLGLFIDYVNWGSFKNTYFQFYYHNLDNNYGRFSDFGIEPWWYFFTETIIQLAPILSIFFVIGIILFWIQNLKNPITWITFTTIFFISLFSHKEIRYIFPVYIFAPLFISYFFENFNFKYLSKLFKFLIIISNIIFLFITIFFPANNKVDVYKFLFNNVSVNSKLYYAENNPYLINNMEPLIYTKFLPKINKLDDKILLKNIWIVSNKFTLIDQLPNNCVLEYTTYPEFIFNLNPNWKRLNLNWYIFKCH